MAATADTTKQSLLDSAVACSNAAQSAAQAALVQAGLMVNPATTEYDKPNLTNAGALAGQASQAAHAARDFAAAWAILNAQISPPVGTTPPAITIGL